MYVLAMPNGGSSGRTLRLTRPPFDFSATVLSTSDSNGGWSRFLWGEKYFVGAVTVSGANAVYVYDRGFRQLLRVTQNGTIYGLATDKAQTMVALGTSGSPYLRVWSLPGGAVLSGTPSVGSFPRSLAFSHDGGLLAACMASNSPYLRIFNTGDWTEVSGVPTLPADSSWCEFSPDGSKLAVLCRSGTSGLHVYSTEDWSLLYSYTRRDSASTANFSFSPDGARIAVGDNAFLDVHDLASSALVSAKYPVFGGAIYQTSWSPDGSLLAVSGNGSPWVRVYETSTWAEVPVAQRPGAVAYACAFSPEWVDPADAPAQTLGGVRHLIQRFSGQDEVQVKISRAVGEDTVPQVARVSLMRQKDHKVMQRRWSGVDGVARFPGVRRDQRYVALAEYPGNPDSPATENYMRPVAGVSLKRGEGNA